MTNSYLIEKHPVDLSLDQVIEIAKEIRGNSKAKELKGTVKEVLGAWYYISIQLNLANQSEAL
jgi:ribosomal protein L11